MKVSKLNEDRLVEVRRRKYLNEMIDFCLYESCLKEETAKQYFTWLLPRVLENVPKNLSNETDVYKTEFSNYENVNEAAKLNLLSNMGDERFAVFANDNEREKDSGIILNYFDDGFVKFKEQLENLLNKMKLSAKKLKMSEKEIKKLEDCFNYYCGLFVKSEIKNLYPYLSVKAIWNDKNNGKKDGSDGVKTMFSYKKDTSGKIMGKTFNDLKIGESWNSKVNVTIDDIKKELNDYLTNHR